MSGDADNGTYSMLLVMLWKKVKKVAKSSLLVDIRPPLLHRLLTTLSLPQILQIHRCHGLPTRAHGHDVPHA
jgi:hypothetical protein